MQNRQSGRRRRGGGGGGNSPRPMGMANGGQTANRLEVRVRGNAHQLLEKYKQLARDAHQAGDRVAAEYYLQHSDHYFRVLNDSRIRQEEMRTRRGVFDPYEDEAQGAEADEADGGVDSGQDGGMDSGQDGDRAETRERPRERFDRPRADRQGNDRQGNDRQGNDRQGQERQGDRQQDRRPRGEDRDGGERQWQDRRPERPDTRRDERRDEVRGQARPQEREDRQRDERPARIAPALAEQALSDGEAALVAFGGVPVREPVQIEAPLEGADAAAEAPKRRRGRPRKVVAEPVDG